MKLTCIWIRFLSLQTPPISATDADTTRFFFFLEGPGAENFYFDPDFGFITTQELFDFEVTSSFPDLVLIVTDLGGLTSNASLEVNLIDVNDNSPMFNPSMINLNVSELAGLGSEVTVVFATDLDQAENGFVTYTLNSDQIASTFIIDSVTGVISVNRPLDYETVQRYTIVVTGRDGGVPQRSGTLTINLAVLDENDNPPIILNPTAEFVIEENVPVNTRVGQVIATDADSGLNAELIFEIVTGNEANRFVMDQTTGTITTNSTIDREEQGLYVFNVEV